MIHLITDYTCFYLDSSSEVRFGVHLISKKKVAAKIESLNAQMQLLKHEKEMYDQLKESNGVADVYYYEDNWNNRYRILVMQQLGHNLESLFTLCHKQFTLKTILYIAIELITHLQTIHSRDILYRNCTPKNFLIGLDEKGLKHLYVVDFACSKLYIDPRTRQHIVDKCDPSIKLGQLRYMSLNVHRGHEHSRRDDLESLGYMFMYFLKQGKLPWSKLKTPQGKASEKERLIYKRKCATPIEMLCLGFHDAFAFFFRSVLQDV